MEANEEKSPGNPNPNHKIRQIFSEFVTQIVKFEELTSIGNRFLTGFQISLNFLRRPPITDSSELIQTVLKSNETKRFKSYLQAGCFNTHDTQEKTAQLNSSLSELHDHLIKAKCVIGELENLMEKASCAIGDAAEKSGDELEVILADWCSFMAAIYGMVKQDYVMQEKIVCGLSLKCSSGELDGYCLMWSLRPFVDDDVVHQALRLCK